MTMIPSTSLLGCKFYHFLPFYVTDCGRQIYYVVHRLQSMSKTTIHLGVHNHPIADGKCRVFIKETRRLITEEVDHTPDVKISSISFNARKSFFVSYLLDDSKDGTL